VLSHRRALALSPTRWQISEGFFYARFSNSFALNMEVFTVILCHANPGIVTDLDLLSHHGEWAMMTGSLDQSGPLTMGGSHAISREEN
jgi:hypothetical protein